MSRELGLARRGGVRCAPRSPVDRRGPRQTLGLRDQVSVMVTASAVELIAWPAMVPVAPL